MQTTNLFRDDREPIDQLSNRLLKNAEQRMVKDHLVWPSSESVLAKAPAGVANDAPVEIRSPKPGTNRHGAKDEEHDKGLNHVAKQRYNITI